MIRDAGNGKARPSLHSLNVLGERASRNAGLLIMFVSLDGSGFGSVLVGLARYWLVGANVAVAGGQHILLNLQGYADFSKSKKHVPLLLAVCRSFIIAQMFFLILLVLSAGILYKLKLKKNDEIEMQMMYAA